MLISNALSRVPVREPLRDFPRENGSEHRDFRDKARHRVQSLALAFEAAKCWFAGMKGTKKLRVPAGGDSELFLELVEARGVEPRSWRNCPMFSTCLAWTFVFSRRLCAMQTTAGAAALFFLAGGIRLPDAPGQPDVCASSRIRHQGGDVTGYAASAYSVFAVIFLTDDLGGQRSSSACLHRSASSVETISPPDFKEQIPGGRHTLILLNRHLT